jgi:hypothetical protein
VYSFKTTTDVPDDRQVTIVLPSDAPTGKADVEVTIAPHEKGASATGGDFSRFFGTVNSGNPNSADNDAIDADLAREYGSSID